MAPLRRTSISSVTNQRHKQQQQLILRSEEVRDAKDHCEFDREEHPSSSLQSTLLLQNLNLDTTEPWERSLLCSLKDQSFNTKESTTPNDQQQQRDVMLLRHTESRDQALQIMEEDDTLSLVSDAYPPLRNNSIYRTRYQEASLLDDETLSTTNSCSKISLKGAFLSQTLSSVTAPDFETRGDHDEPECRRPSSSSSGHVRHASDGDKELAYRCSSARRHCRRFSAPIILRASVISEEPGSPHRHHRRQNNSILEMDSLLSGEVSPNSILASTTDSSSVRSMSSTADLGGSGTRMWWCPPYEMVAILPFPPRRGSRSTAKQQPMTPVNDVVEL